MQPKEALNEKNGNITEDLIELSSRERGNESRRSVSSRTLSARRIPIWWRWYVWICPVYYTLYGLLVTQFGDVKDKFDTGESVEDFVRDYFGYNTNAVGYIAAEHIAIVIIFGFTFAYSIKTFNFQKR
ncbi:hypothetical protein ACFE04_018083 [Oxalis oulophora]